MEKCIICHKDIYTIKAFIHKQILVCNACLAKQKGVINKMDYNALRFCYLYVYDEVKMGYLVKLKGLYDQRFSDVLINSVMRQKLKKAYKNYILIGMPSFKEADLKRGFNHVEELFKDIGTFISPLEKIADLKQSKIAKKHRKTTNQNMQLKADFDITCLNNRKILLVDDVLTSGATIKGAIELLNLKEYEILVCLFANYVEIKR